MNRDLLISAFTAAEPERYELTSPPTHRFQPGRREFLKLAGGGIVVACVLKEAWAAQESGGGRRGFGEALPQEVSAWLHIGEDGVVTVYTGKVEVGQNTRTALTQAVAEELRVSPNVIRVVMGDTDLTPFDTGTFGSRSTPVMSPQLRRAASAAREMLIDLAADNWKIKRARLVAIDGKITDPSTRRTVAYAELAKGQKLAKAIPAEHPLTPTSEWKVMGKPQPKVDGRDFVTGRHRYASDLRVPGMLYGKVLRPSRRVEVFPSALGPGAVRWPEEKHGGRCGVGRPGRPRNR
jgi:isoquinoline 1-oxidoreductase